MKEKKFTKEHEWIHLKDNEAFIGITDHAQQQLGDVVFIQLPEIGFKCIVGGEVAVIESVKAASEIYAPISGTVVEVNEKLIDNPEIINTHAEKDGWIWKMSVENPNEMEGLMDSISYSKIISESA